MGFMPGREQGHLSSSQDSRKLFGPPHGTAQGIGLFPEFQNGFFVVAAVVVWRQGFFL